MMARGKGPCRKGSQDGMSRPAGNRFNLQPRSRLNEQPFRAWSTGHKITTPHLDQTSLDR
jgi:hypothetical protein